MRKGNVGSVCRTSLSANFLNKTKLFFNWAYKEVVEGLWSPYKVTFLDEFYFQRRNEI